MSDTVEPKAVKQKPKADTDADRPFQLAEWPFYWLTHTFGRYQIALEKLLKPMDLDVPRWRVLMLLNGDESQSITILAKEAITKLSTMTRIVQRMERDGLVKTSVSAIDARVTVVSLAAKGKRVRESAWIASDQIYDLAFEGISKEKIRRMNKLLMGVYDNLEP